MALTNRFDILALASRCVLEPKFDYKEKLNELNISKNKKSFVFGLSLDSQWIEMEGIEFRLKKKKFYVSVQACKLSQFLDFIQHNKIVYIEIYCSKTLCTKKWFNHWDYKALKMYPYCKKYSPLWGYYCFPEYDNVIRMLPGSGVE